MRSSGVGSSSGDAAKAGAVLVPARSVGALLPLTLFAFFVSAALSTLAVVVMNSAQTERGDIRA